MAGRGAEWKVGLAVLTAIVVLIVGIVWLSEAHIGNEGMRLQVRFKSAGGIAAGDPVRVAGVKTGSVSSVELGDREVMVGLQLAPEVILYEDAAFKITNFGIMGEMQIAIKPGSGGALIDPKIVHEGVFQTDITSAMKEAGPILEDVRSILDKLDAMLEEDALAGSLQELVVNLESVSGEMESLMKENRGNIEGTLASSRSAAEGVDRLLKNHEGDIDTALSSFAETSDKLNDLVGRMDGITTSMESLLAKIDAGEGTLGKLAQDDTVYNEFLRTMDNVNLLLTDVRENPKRYVKIEIF